MAAPPPRKRQRRLVVLSSDEDEACISICSSQTSSTSQQRPKTRLSPAQSVDAPVTSSADVNGADTRRSKAKLKKAPSNPSNRHAAAPSPSPASSPEKRRTRKKPVPDKSSPSKSLHSFFTPATEEQRWSRIREDCTPDIVEEIEDEEDAESILTWGASQSFSMGMSSQTAKNGQKNGHSSAQEASVISKNGQKQDETLKAALRPKPTKRFLIPGNTEAGKPSSHAISEQLRPWTERFAPANLDELAVHKKKVADVQNWLVDVFTGRSRRRMLVLRGPAGSGKTTTVSLLSKALGYDMIEWKNSSAVDYSSAGYVSMGAQFDDFLGRSDKFSSLTLSEASSSSKSSLDGDSNPSGNRRRVILIEEFPTSLAQGSSTLMTFRSTLQAYLAAAVPLLGLYGAYKNSDVELSPPVIIIVSETMLGTGAALSDNFTVYRLLGPEISNHPGVSIIEFNRVAPTFITKALDIVLKKEARVSKRRRIPGPAALKGFAEMGDVRSAIASLEFLCLRGDEDADWSGTVSGRLKKGGRSNAALTHMEKDSLEAITQREASLGIFHAVGKVVYNKREDPAVTGSSNAEVPQPPQHLHHFARRKISQGSIDDLINETGTDTHTFIAALHENYILSCESEDFTDYFTDCITELSNADILGTDGHRGVQSTRNGVGSARLSYQGSGTSVDLLRQDEISFQVAGRGLLFSLPYPVKRRTAPGAYGGDTHKMFFPTSMRLWRQTEEVCGMLDIWTRRLTSGATSTHSSEFSSRTEGVASWGGRGVFGQPTDEHDTNSPSMTGKLTMSSQEILLDYLPYLRMITKDPSEMKDLEGIAQFHGVVGRNNDISDEDFGVLEDPSAEHWATDPLPKSPQKRVLPRTMPPPPRPPRFKGANSAQQVEEGVDNLVLSDDDIED